MRAFARAKQFTAFAIKLRPPLDEFRDSLRPLGDKNLRGRPIHKSIPGGNGVFQVQSDILVALGRDGDPALRVVRIRLAQRLLGDHQHVAVVSQFESRAQARYARAHHQKIHRRGHHHKFRGYHSDRADEATRIPWRNSLD